MSDSTLHIGTLASNNVNNIVNDTSKYDEYKEKVKELEKELQTRKDTFEKMTEPLVYVCDCYQKFNVVTGMPKSTFGDSFGYAMQKEISDYMQDFYAWQTSWTSPMAHRPRSSSGAWLKYVTVSVSMTAP